MIFLSHVFFYDYFVFSQLGLSLTFLMKYETFLVERCSSCVILQFSVQSTPSRCCVFFFFYFSCLWCLSDKVYQSKKTNNSTFTLLLCVIIDGISVFFASNFNCFCERHFIALRHKRMKSGLIFYEHFLQTLKRCVGLFLGLIYNRLLNDLF